jgi:hypothetical protein
LGSQHWPTLADPWVEKCRQKGWPSANVLNDITQSGFHVVPISCDHNTEDEWRISFAQAEQKLIYSMNHSQFLCYGLLKIFLKEVINFGITDPILSSYFMKTILFWVILEDVSVIWTPGNLLLNFWRCFKFLTDGVLRGECPNFFIPQNNMFKMKVTGAAKDALFVRLSDLYCMKMIPCLLLSPTIVSYLRPVIVDRTLTVRTDEETIMPDYELDMQVFNEIYKLSVPVLSMKQFAVYLTNIEKVFRRRKGPFQLVIVQRMISDVLLRSAWYMASYTATENRCASFVSHKVCHLLETASKLGYVSDVLHLAMYHYRKRRYEQSLRCIQSVQRRMVAPHVIFKNNDNVLRYRSAMSGASLSDKMRKAVVSDIKLISAYYYIEELLLEQVIGDFNGVAAILIPPLVMLLMLTVLNHHRLRHKPESQIALKSLQTLVLSDEGRYIPLIQRDISYQILGICQQVCGDSSGALKSYQSVLQEEPFHEIRQASICRIQTLAHA